MRQLTTALTAALATLLLAACAKKEEAPATEAPPAPEAAPADTAPATDASTDAEQSGGDKVSEPEPAPTGG